MSYKETRWGLYPNYECEEKGCAYATLDLPRMEIHQADHMAWFRKAEGIALAAILEEWTVSTPDGGAPFSEVRAGVNRRGH